MQPMLTDRKRVLRRLNIIRWIALADFCLLIALVTASLTGTRWLVQILGPIHGGNFLLLVVVAVTAATDKLWSWWFPLTIFLTGGPIGAFVGEWLLRRQLNAPQADGNESTITSTEAQL